MDSRAIEEIRLRTRSRVLELRFSDGGHCELPFEYLRVYSPSAEVQGHGPGQEVLVTGKENVRIVEVEPVGNYAVRLVFDDGHDSGLYTFAYLQALGAQQQENWRTYLARLEQAGVRRSG